MRRSECRKSGNVGLLPVAVWSRVGRIHVEYATWRYLRKHELVGSLAQFRGFGCSCIQISVVAIRSFAPLVLDSTSPQVTQLSVLQNREESSRGVLSTLLSRTILVISPLCKCWIYSIPRVSSIPPYQG